MMYTKISGLLARESVDSVRYTARAFAPSEVIAQINSFS